MPDTIPSLNRTVSEINRQYGANTIGTLDKMPSLQMERILTEIPSFDDAVGGGLPFGRLVEFFGIPSSGKSLISLVAIGKAQKKGLNCIYMDAENSFDPIFAQKLGVDTDKLVVTQITTGEDVIDVICKLLDSQPGIIVLDSVAAIVPRKEMEVDMDQATMALKARLLSRGLAKVNALNKKTLIIFINQLRSTLTMYGAPSTTPGGRALPHFSSVRVEVKQGDKINKDNKKTGDVIGHVVQFLVKKNKTAAPFKQGNFKFFYEDVRIEA
jgi:recombination protein RecA